MKFLLKMPDKKEHKAALPYAAVLATITRGVSTWALT